MCVAKASLGPATQNRLAGLNLDEQKAGNRSLRYNPALGQRL